MIFQTSFPPAAEGRRRAAALPAPRQLAIQLLLSCLNNQDAAPHRFAPHHTTAHEQKLWGYLLATYYSSLTTKSAQSAVRSAGVSKWSKKFPRPFWRPKSRQGGGGAVMGEVFLPRYRGRSSRALCTWFPSPPGDARSRRMLKIHRLPETWAWANPANLTAGYERGVRLFSTKHIPAWTTRELGKTRFLMASVSVTLKMMFFVFFFSFPFCLLFFPIKTSTSVMSANLPGVKQ